MAGRVTWANPSNSLYPCAGLAYPQSVRNAGTNFDVEGLAFDGTTSEGGAFKFRLTDYTSGNLTLELVCYADSGTTNAYVFDGALCFITPDSDTQDVETDSFATATTGAESHLGTTAQRVQKLTITLTNLDSAADGDIGWLRVRRLPADAGDTMTGIDVILLMASLSWS